MGDLGNKTLREREESYITNFLIKIKILGANQIVASDESFLGSYWF